MTVQDYSFMIDTHCTSRKGYLLKLYWLKHVQARLSYISRHMAHAYWVMCLNMFPPGVVFAGHQGTHPRVFTLRSPYSSFLKLRFAPLWPVHKWAKTWTYPASSFPEKDKSDFLLASCNLPFWGLYNIFCLICLGEYSSVYLWGTIVCFSLYW